jgi:hypothetical protein
MDEDITENRHSKNQPKYLIRRQAPPANSRGTAQPECGLDPLNGDIVNKSTQIRELKQIFKI